MFHYVCLECDRGFGRIKARTNQNPEYVVLKLKKEEGRGEKSSRKLLLTDLHFTTQKRFSSAFLTCHPGPAHRITSPWSPALGCGWEAAPSLQGCHGAELVELQRDRSGLVSSPGAPGFAQDQREQKTTAVRSNKDFFRSPRSGTRGCQQMQYSQALPGYGEGEA